MDTLIWVLRWSSSDFLVKHINKKTEINTLLLFFAEIYIVLDI